MTANTGKYEKPRRKVLHHILILETKCVEKATSKIKSKTSRLIREIELNLKGKRFEKLCYCGQSCRKIPDALAKLYGPKVHSLDLSYNELVTLRGLEDFAELNELVLDNNQLGDSISVPPLAKLHTLSLNKNNIHDLESLLYQIREKLPSLSYFSLLGNRACPNQLSGQENDDEDYQRYRYFVLFHLPNLKFLDSNRVSDEEKLVAKNRGRYMNVIRPKSLEGDAVGVDVNISQLSITGNLNYTPLPRSMRGPEDHKGAYGKCRYRYSGKHSEGNRFISNNDL